MLKRDSVRALNPSGSTAATQQQSESRPLVVSGVLINLANGHTLGGLTVIAYYFGTDEADQKEGPASKGEKSRRTPEAALGQGISDMDGRFTIVFSQMPSVQQKLFLVMRYPGTSFVLQVEDAAGKPYLTSPPLTVSSGFPITLSVPLPAGRQQHFQLGVTANRNSSRPGRPIEFLQGYGPCAHLGRARVRRATQSRRNRSSAG